MIAYSCKRLLSFVCLLWAAATLVFFMIHLLPGDAAVHILGHGATASDIARLRTELNMDRPLLQRYGRYLWGLVTLDLGRSLYNRKPVTDNILAYLTHTLVLALAAMTVAVLLSMPLGLLAACRVGSKLDVGITLFCSLGQALPNFFLGPLLILFFSVRLDWLPVSGAEGFESLVLPALTLGWSMSALLTRILRRAVATELSKPYSLLARAKGLSTAAVLGRHVLRNAAVPVITTMGLQMGALLGGTVITETVFSWPGLGTLLIQSVRRRDCPMVQGLVLFMTAVFLIVHFIADLMYAVSSPETRHAIKKR
jgi:peptide/nickel transport system permease protein